MNTKAFLTTAAIAATTIASMTGASAQTINGVNNTFPAPGSQKFLVNVQTSAIRVGSIFKYTYTLTNDANSYPSAPSVNLINFLFGAPATVTSVPVDFTNSGSATSSFFSFVGFPGLTAGSTDTFTFTSPNAPVLQQSSITANAFGADASGGGTSLQGPGIVTPEPGSMVSLSVLGACLGLGILARRKSMSN